MKNKIKNIKFSFSEKCQGDQHIFLWMADSALDDRPPAEDARCRCGKVTWGEYRKRVADVISNQECHDAWADCGRKVSWAIADRILDAYLPNSTSRFVSNVPEEKREEFIAELKKAIQEKKDEGRLKKDLGSA